MFGSSQSGANAYATVGTETGVAAASPHGLIVMLFDGAIVSLKSAIQLMNAGDIPGKGSAISRTILIIDGGLRASLNKTAGGEIAANLDSLYEYMSMQLLQANLKNRLELLHEVLSLLEDLRSSWNGIAPNSLPAARSVPKPPPIYDALAPRSTTFTSA
ncbi:flagellar export chaperone FliS [Undibacterium fentianense]|uniref:Flagellar export chaperone FliS n=1 Tax=Undibacterium fentianense TaxID=2828728 RepID=A0A941IE12_9BURK|nr:flagellar export chaperone FliS [Undibacterium fentianense]MBR7798932.1 flagellar export chaperone FliS [Undibacterium fentianense]